MEGLDEFSAIEVGCLCLVILTLGVVIGVGATYACYRFVF